MDQTPLGLDVRRAVWEGSIPVQIRISPADLSPHLPTHHLHALKSAPFYVPTWPTPVHMTIFP